MSSSIQGLLRLPACLRRQAILELTPREQSILRNSSFVGTVARRFKSTTSIPRQQPKLKAQPTSAASPLRHAPAPRTAPPPPPPPPPGGGEQRFQFSYTDHLLANHPEVLIYRGPSHGSFRFATIFWGTAMIVGSYFGTKNALNPKAQPGEAPPVIPWWVKSFSMVTPLFFAVFATRLAIAPMKTFKSISVAVPSIKTTASRVHGQGLKLRCEKRSWLPFQKPSYIEAAPSEIFLNRTVAAVDMKYTNIPLTQADEFTANYNHKPVSKPMGNPVKAMLHALWRDTRRMFYRDGFAYLRFEGGTNWKIDLQECELLDHGRALERFTTPETLPNVGMIGLFRKKFLKT